MQLSLFADSHFTYLELKADLTALDAEILDHSPDAVKRRHRADSLKGPVPAIEDVTKSWMGFRSKLKQRKLERIKQFGPIARSIALRALIVVEGTWGLVHEREKDCAAAYAFAFRPSHTLEALANARVPLREVVGISERAPDLVDPGFIDRLAEGFGPSE